MGRNPHASTIKIYRWADMDTYWADMDTYWAYKFDGEHWYSWYTDGSSECPDPRSPNWRIYTHPSHISALHGHLRKNQLKEVYSGS